MSRPTKIERLRELLKYVRMESCSFDRSFGDPIILTEKQVTDFIRERTRLSRQTWVIPIVEELIAAEERRRKIPKGNQNARPSPKNP